MGPGGPEPALETTVVRGRALPDGLPVVGLAVTYCGRVPVQRTL